MKMVKLSLSVIVTMGLAISSFADGAALYKKCSACHGMNAEKKALGKSQIIADMNGTEIVSALKGYKDGSYGGAMKGLMKGQVTNYSEDQIIEVAEYISKLGK